MLSEKVGKSFSAENKLNLRTLISESYRGGKYNTINNENRCLYQKSAYFWILSKIYSGGQFLSGHPIQDFQTSFERKTLLGAKRDLLTKSIVRRKNNFLVRKCYTTILSWILSKNVIFNVFCLEISLSSIVIRQIPNIFSSKMFN